MLIVEATVAGHGRSVPIALVLFALVFGFVLALNGVVSLLARRIRRTEATLGLGYRVQERLAPASIKIGMVLIALGLVGGILIWIQR
jgi:hypothetical protein